MRGYNGMRKSFAIIDKTSKWRWQHWRADAFVVSNETAATRWRSIMRFDSSYLLIATAWAGPKSLLILHSVYDYRGWGDPHHDYPMSTLDSSAQKPGRVLAVKTFIRVNAPNKDGSHSYIRNPEIHLQYLEHDWIDRTKTASTSLNCQAFASLLSADRVT